MIVIDCETTSSDPYVAGLISIGAVYFNPQYPSNHLLSQFYSECQIRHDAPLDPAALVVNGFTPARLREPSRPTLQSLLKTFFYWVEQMPDRDLAAMNASFDYTCLVQEAKRCNLKNPISSRTIDLHAVCYAKMLELSQPIPHSENNESRLTTKRILNFVGLPPEPIPHIAINGALIETEAFSRLIYGHGCLPQYSSYPIRSYFNNH